MSELMDQMFGLPTFHADGISVEERYGIPRFHPRREEMLATIARGDIMEYEKINLVRSIRGS